jgi:hypothetical protein
MSQELDPLTSLINSPSVEPLEKGEPKSSHTNTTPELKNLLESPSHAPLSAGGQDRLQVSMKIFLFNIKNQLLIILIMVFH